MGNKKIDVALDDLFHFLLKDTEYCRKCGKLFIKEKLNPIAVGMLEDGTVCFEFECAACQEKSNGN